MDTTISKTIQKIKFGLFFACAVFLLGVTGCERSSLVEQAADPATQMFLNDDPECIEGERREFGMAATTEEHVLLTGMNMHFSYFALPAYSPSSECLCKVEHVHLEFDYLPPAGDITVMDEQGDVLAFSGPLPSTTGPGVYIEVYANDHEPNIMIGFDPPLDPMPSLQLAGGYCLIDNVSAPNPTTLLTTPYIKHDPENQTKRTYIPAAGATAVQ